MSAIAGLWRQDGRPVEPRDLELMAVASGRGSGPPGFWLGGPVGLMHVAALDQTERQPLLGAEGTLVLCADSRLDDRESLIARLGLDDRPGGEFSDAELLLAAYERWGAVSPARVLGDFAFAVWDAKRRSMVCARDHFGVRPLYYAHLPGILFAFASDVRSLLALDEIDPAIDESRVARHLSIPGEDDPRATYYRNVRRILPAHVLRVTEQGLTETAYWNLDPEREATFSSDDESVEALREAFTEAVRCRMRSNAPIAAMLSGGLDSSAIAAVAALVGESSGQAPIRTLSAVYPQVPESDEREYIDAFLGRLDVTPSIFAADSVNPLGCADEISGLIGGPCRGRNLYLNWTLAGIARDAGCRVVLDGFDGDSTLSHATNYLVALALSGRWIKLASVLAPFSRREGSSPWRDYRSYWRFGRRRRAIAAGKAGEPVIQVPGTMPLNEAFLNRSAGQASPWELGNQEREMHARHLSGPFLAEVLGWIEACGAGRSVEIRFPFFDVRLAELCVSLPPRQKLRRGFARYTMRRAMEGILPKEIQWRVSKGNMHPAWNHAYRSHEDGRVRDLLAHPSARVAEYLDPARALSLHERFLRGDVSRSEEGVWWSVVSLVLWLG